MSSTDDDSTDRLEAVQATPRTTVQDAGNIEGGSLSATRLLRSLGKFVGLGSAAPDPGASNPPRTEHRDRRWHNCQIHSECSINRNVVGFTH